MTPSILLTSKDELAPVVGVRAIRLVDGFPWNGAGRHTHAGRFRFSFPFSLAHQRFLPRAYGVPGAVRCYVLRRRAGERLSRFLTRCARAPLSQPRDDSRCDYPNSHGLVLHSKPLSVASFVRPQTYKAEKLEWENPLCIRSKNK